MRIPRLKRLPSPALVVACVALFAALGGTSYALATGSITSREIQDGTIRNPDFKDGTLRGQEFKRDSLGGGAIKEQSLDGAKLPAVASATQATGLAAQLVVAADGARSNDRGVVSSAKLDDGRYQVIFDRDVRTCLLSATLVEQPPPPADPTAPVTGQIAVAPLAGNANGVHISTTDSAGAYADRSFHLLVSC